MAVFLTESVMNMRKNDGILLFCFHALWVINIFVSVFRATSSNCLVPEANSHQEMGLIYNAGMGNCFSDTLLSEETYFRFTVFTGNWPQVHYFQRGKAKFPEEKEKKYCTILISK